ncbi:class I SAM-dependent methyltransferase [Marinihelvus fidelis]|uniref:Class I SAM-dependent methyltransferase n=1 Tax=Marinihelvus fidelis TaxID=2613842 RepID=A0A5N0TA31_9GAMM|nr:class I SAM-dependent methyltransferase [Marinihelvus fidelis]KAA9131631.1 class I SAM-dependent methyltransferase [Marinihelvus fidelis]
MSGENSIEQLKSLGDGRFEITFAIADDMLFDIDLQLQLFCVASGQELQSIHIRQAGWDVAWLPRGRYVAEVDAGSVTLPTTGARPKALLWDQTNNKPRLLSALESGTPITEGRIAVPDRLQKPSWSLRSLDGLALEDLSWNRGHDDWFFKHFDHAARVIVNLMLADNELLKGRVLDVGCGDGMTDLGVFLRCRPREFVGIDPSRRFDLLDEVAARNHIPDDWKRDPALRFEPFDANALPFDDDHFDVVLSWGSFEHIVGGYAQSLREIRRVLKPGGLLFAHPGLFYGEYGNHLGEFFDDPWIHLKLPPEELEKRVKATPPDYMDRGGEFASPDDYWQWYTELNPITVTDFEKELRDLGFEPWRVALRTSNLVEYTPELQQYGFEQLANTELYVSAWNRK